MVTRSARCMVVPRALPKEIVRGLIDDAVSTELRQRGDYHRLHRRPIPTIAESADPDILMHQTSRYFSVLTEAFLAEGGTVDKFIGDAVMVFWNALRSPDHVSGPAGQPSRAERCEAQRPV